MAALSVNGLTLLFQIFCENGLCWSIIFIAVLDATGMNGLTACGRDKCIAIVMLIAKGTFLQSIHTLTLLMLRLPSSKAQGCKDF